MTHPAPSTGGAAGTPPVLPAPPPAMSFGPRVRKSPYFDATLRWGAQSFTIYNHTYMPTSYGDSVDEYWSLVTRVTLWDVACERQIRIHGPQALELMELLTPRDLSDCPTNKCLYVVLTAPDGGIVNDAVLMRLGEDELWLSPGDGDVELWAQGVAARAGMDVDVADANIAPLQLQGPKSPHVARRLFGNLALQLPYYGVTQLEYKGIPLALSRTGWSGELGYEIYLRDPAAGDDLWEAVMAAGERYGIAPATPNTIRSIEGGLLSYQSDIRREDNPWTFGLDRLVHLDKKSDFIGREALKRIQAAGGHRRLVGIEIEGEAISHNEEFWTVSRDGEQVGHVSRCAWSPRLERNIGFANLPAGLTTPGTAITVEAPGGPLAATVAETPWFDAQKTLPPIGPDD